MTESLGFLLTDVARLMRRRFDERARGHAATVTQWRTLKVLKRTPGLNQGQIAELLEVEPITACRMIDRLEEAGLVERRRDPADRRAWRIFLTPAADPVIAELVALSDVLMEECLEGLSGEQRRQLSAILETIRTNLTHEPQSKEAAHG